METLENDRGFDIRKIIIAVVVVLGMIWFGYQNKDMILGTQKSLTKTVAGDKTEKQTGVSKVSLPKIDLQQKLDDLKQQVITLDVADITSSSPQIQKVIHDMESLQNVPRSQAKEACMKICSNL